MLGSREELFEKLKATDVVLEPYRQARKRVFDRFCKDIPKIYGNSEVEPDERDN